MGFQRKPLCTVYEPLINFLFCLESVCIALLHRFKTYIVVVDDLTCFSSTMFGIGHVVNFISQIVIESKASFCCIVERGIWCMEKPLRCEVVDQCCQSVEQEPLEYYFSKNLGNKASRERHIYKYILMHIY
jgi:hypothetical protein